MKKKDVLDLIKYHFENNNTAFKNKTLEIARDFNSNSDEELAAYIMGIISNTDRFVPQGQKSNQNFQSISLRTSVLPLPTPIGDDIKGILNAINRNIGVHKFLFSGSPGTGKTESVKQIARISGRELLMIDFNQIIDSKMGQTSKNLSELFEEMNNMPNPEKLIFLFDEIDALVMDRINSNDLREMGRVTSTFLKLVDDLDDRIVLIATTNLFENIDKALTRRFDAVVNFDRYSKEDLIDIAEIILDDLLKQFTSSKREIRLFRKILYSVPKLPYPADLKIIIRKSLAFSKEENEYEYLIRILKSFHNGKMPDMKKLKNLNFTVREIEILTGVSKSSVSRLNKENEK